MEALARATPAAHLVRAGRVLIDTGDGSPGADARIDAWLAGHEIELIALTHGHADHAGGVERLRERLGVPVALHADEVADVTPQAAYLHQWLGSFAVDRTVRDGDVLPGGLEVVHTPGQTPGHVAYWDPGTGTVASGDLLQGADVAWLPFAPGTVATAIASIARLADLGARRAIPGHGPPVTDVPAAAARTIARYEAWQQDPTAQARHLSRRMAAARLALHDPRPTLTEATATLAEIPIVGDAARILGLDADGLAAEAYAQLLGSGAVAQVEGRLHPRFEHEAVSRRAAPRAGA